MIEIEKRGFVSDKAEEKMRTVLDAIIRANQNENWENFTASVHIHDRLFFRSTVSLHLYDEREERKTIIIPAGIYGKKEKKKKSLVWFKYSIPLNDLKVKKVFQWRGKHRWRTEIRMKGE